MDPQSFDACTNTTTHARARPTGSTTSESWREWNHVLQLWHSLLGHVFAPMATRNCEDAMIQTRLYRWPTGRAAQGPGNTIVRVWSQVRVLSQGGLVFPLDVRLTPLVLDVEYLVSATLLRGRGYRVTYTHWLLQCPQHTHYQLTDRDAETRSTPIRDAPHRSTHN